MTATLGTTLSQHMTILSGKLSSDHTVNITHNQSPTCVIDSPKLDPDSHKFLISVFLLFPYLCQKISLKIQIQKISTSSQWVANTELIF